ncbi:MAG TPA: phosphatase PAP2 family protein [Gemmatimonadaceae bacterium]|nr:phosphatase PAP2 family protein [Gemmatimonadaceae bacterium]
MRALRRASIALVLFPALALAQEVATVVAPPRDASTLAPQVPGDTHDKTFLTRRDFIVLGVGAAATGVLSIFDDDIAVASQQSRWQSKSLHDFSLNVSKAQETTLTVASILTYGIGRLTKQRTVADVGLHSAESVILASLASQLIRGPLGRSRPHAAGDTNQYDFHFGKGFTSFDNRAFPSIHTSSGMAVATVLTMEMQRRHVAATPYVAPLLFAAGILPGLSRIQLDQHWASDVLAGAFMGVFSGYKVVSYSHDHPNNRFDRVLLKMSATPDPMGGWRVGYSLY